MREQDLRAVLLVKALEEADTEGTLVPPADRLDAARLAKRAGADSDPLVHRAKSILARVVARHPFVAQVESLAGGAAWIGWVAIAVGLLAGVALSALDGVRRINVLAFPLVGLIAWNLAMYVVVMVQRLRTARDSAPRGQWLAALSARAWFGRARSLVAQSKAFDARLAEALKRFIAEWGEAARPMLLARATRMLHLAAAAVGIGLVAGLYARGIAFEYQAGWESTFLDAGQAHRLLAVFYGPASWVTGIALPDVAHLEAIRWRGTAGGEPAGRWIHLLAATALLFVVLPRLLLALLATLSIARWTRDAKPPASLEAYARRAFSGVGGLREPGTVRVVPCAYELGTNALARLRTILGEEMGEGSTIELAAPARYGEEDAFLAALDAHGATGGMVLLFNLATTPEDENHGMVMAGVRDHMARHAGAPLIVMVDEGPYRARMAGMPQRIDERRRAWKDFIAARGLEPRFVDLAP